MSKFKYKYRKSGLFYKFLWGIIFFCSILLLLKSIRTYGIDSSGKAIESLGSKLVSEACNYMMQSQFPILNYVTDKEDDGKSSIIINTLAGVFPINRYVADTGDNLDQNEVKEENNTLLFSSGFNLLFNQDTYNPDLYKQDIIDGGEQDNGLEYGESDSTENIPVDIINGDVYMEDDYAVTDDVEATETLGTINGEYFTLKQLLDRQFLYNNFYIVDSATVVSDELFDAEVLLGKDMTMEADAKKPQILIYHTHSQEAFIDSRAGKEEDTIVGVGSYLTKVLEEKYGFNVIHDKSQYDMMEGYLERNLAYNHANEGISKILEENPTIEVILDLHRDGVSDDLPKGSGKRLAKVNGNYVAQIMLFNGLCKNAKGPISRLKNPYIQDNLAFSLQVQLKGRERFPGLMYKNYLHAYRYNMNFRKKSLLVEIGTNRNTVGEAMNSMELLADILSEVLVEGKSDTEEE